VGPEDPVEGARGEAVLGQLELERGHVPTCLTDQQWPAAQGVPREAAERPPRLRTDDAVDGDASVDLEAADRLRGRRALDPVDRAGIEPTRVQTDLEGGHARIGRGALGGGESRGEDEGQYEKRPDAHWGRPFSSWRFGSLDCEQVFV
jgi:hypothetical protein